jgi:hypothetical protein
MENNSKIESKILIYETDDDYKDVLKSFCQDYNLKGGFVATPELLMPTIKSSLNVGGIIICGLNHEVLGFVCEINVFFPSIPIFIRSVEIEVTNQFLQMAVNPDVIKSYQSDDFDTLKTLMSDFVFNKVFPEGWIQDFQAMACEAMIEKFRDTHVTSTNVFMSSDRRIYGERIELMSIRSDWCEGVVMLQSVSSDIIRVINDGKTTFTAHNGRAAWYAEDLMRELMNSIWGAFKSKYIPSDYVGREGGIDVPLTINHKEGYISFGAADPLVGFSFDLERYDPESGEILYKFNIYLKFSFHLHWDSEKFIENEEELVDSGELEFF